MPYAFDVMIHFDDFTPALLLLLLSCNHLLRRGNSAMLYSTVLLPALMEYEGTTDGNNLHYNRFYGSTYRFFDSH
jgi:hypothetical protein